MPIWTEQQLDAAIAANEIGFITLDTSIFDKFGCNLRYRTLQRLDRRPEAMRPRRQTVDHPFGTLKSWMGSTHFQMKTLKHMNLPSRASSEGGL